MARTTLADLIAKLRSMTSSGTADFTRGTASFWDADQLQTVLDNHRSDVWGLAVSPQPTYSGGTVVYVEYPLPVKDIEATDAGTAIFYLETGAHAQIGTANYSVDYQRGQVTFTSNQSGSAVYLNCRHYDLNGAAAQVWGDKAAYHAAQFDFGTDNTNVKHSQQYDHCQAMAAHYFAKSAEAVNVITMFRSDLEVNRWD